LRQPGQGDHHAIECFLFTPEFLGFFGVVPDGWVF
jgi:hypothetical protein